MASHDVSDCDRMNILGVFTSQVTCLVILLFIAQQCNCEHNVGVVIRLDAYESIAYALTLLGSLARKQRELAGPNLTLSIDVFVVSPELSAPLHGHALSHWDADEVGCSAFLASLGQETRRMESKMLFAEHGQSLRSWSSNKTVLLAVDLWLSPDVCDGETTSELASVRSRCFVALTSDAVKVLEQGIDFSPWGSARRKLEVWVPGPWEEEKLSTLASSRRLGIRSVLLPFALNDAVVVEGWRDEGVTGRRRRETKQRRRLTIGVFAMRREFTSCEIDAVIHSCRVVSETNKQNKEDVASGKKALDQVMQAELLLGGHSSLIANLTSLMARIETCSLLNKSKLLTLTRCVTKSDVRSAMMEHNVSIMMFLKQPHPCLPATRTLALQAQHAGVAILSERTRVMMEIVTDGHDGVLIDKRERREEEEREGNLADWKSGLMKMTSLQDSEGNSMCLLRRLSSGQPGIVLARQHAFLLHVWYRLTRKEFDRPPTTRFVVSVFMWKSNEHVLFAIASKPSLSFVREFRSKTKLKLLVWTWDLIDYEEDKTRRKWFEEVINLVDAAFLNEMGREYKLWLKQHGAEVHYVDDGTVTIGDRGGGRRPKRFPLIDTEDAVVFVGSLQGDDPLRTRAIRALLDADIKVNIYGPEEPWARAGFRTAGEVWAEDAAAVDSAAQLVLCVSRSSSPLLSLYKSDRLFRSAGAGACILCNDFRGLDLLLPPDSVAVLPMKGDEVDPHALVAAAKELLANKTRRRMNRVLVQGVDMLCLDRLLEATTYFTSSMSLCPASPIPSMYAAVSELLRGQVQLSIRLASAALRTISSSSSSSSFSSLDAWLITPAPPLPDVVQQALRFIAFHFGSHVRWRIGEALEAAERGEGEEERKWEAEDVETRRGREGKSERGERQKRGRSSEVLALERTIMLAHRLFGYKES
ncbi:hypothetical protein GUITHDRAFT_135084 [Guillardia theta CCMP2712]|uniref:Spore protein YkvP/CgeB glycosyl transferase-like domain-containing protein n=1 Tax=Guillardia theta (strain CCMP2712) TaxID=905079 RepID=L1JQD6_GUITC|nr:hypothetical protein GUITHDRAFT_135084 [Guillardia theta CCMP2712]EKX50395.1 hypothetical protein GUITHDRAFT_135084 [Guillardia theta CCMP2712]|eukprot:XP_005837375.1 hypothetical protein GUITHDRAFT_135084 [Guillardia theta CCMP2712]